MVNLPPSPTGEYRCLTNLNLYDSPELTSLATQAAADRQLRITSLDSGFSAIAVCLCEDDYPGWLDAANVAQLAPADVPYQAQIVPEAEVRDRIPQVIAFTQAAMAQPNQYLWGGTVAPNYDCSGLMQAAFASVGIVIPRDAYQQEAFAQPIALDALQPGDLVFFGPPAKATHVGLYLGEGGYIHSSGNDQGHNGIYLDRLTADGEPISQVYFAQFRGAGRIIASYCPRSRS